MPTRTRARTGLIRAATVLAIFTACLFWTAPEPSLAQVPPPPSSLIQKPPSEPREDMTEDLRGQVDTIVVVSMRDPAGERVSGSYDKYAYGVLDGAAAGHEAGKIKKEVGPVPVSFRIPGTAIPGMIIGGLLGGVQREVQELRDALTEELVDAESTPLADDGLALDVFWGLRRVPELNSKLIAPTAPVPEDADAMLHVNFGGVAIDIQGKNAVITTTAVASLRRLGNNRELYHTIVHYQDRDSLRNWTENDNSLWHSYVNYARHYLGREIAARVYNRLELPQTLTPEATASVQRDRKNPLHFVSKSTQPELAWTLEIADLSSGPWSDKAGKLDESVTWYDIEIYDRDRLVLFEENVPEPRYAVQMELGCGDYRWSVRPAWRVGGAVRHGHWMRFPPAKDTKEGEDDEQPPNGLIGRAASQAPAYTQDFPSLTIACGRR